MLRRLEYLLFVICVILAALFAPKFLFAIQDRATNQTVYAQYQEINVSSVLVSNYIEDDAERYTTYLYRKSQGTEFEAMELEGSLNNGEILVLLDKALGLSDIYGDSSFSYGFEMFDGNVFQLNSTQYAIYDSQDHSDIMFLATLITIELDNGNEKFSDDGNIGYYDVIKILVDSQTGELYFIGFYYLYYPFEEYEKIFSGSAYDAAKGYERMIDDIIPNMEEHTYLNLLSMSIFPYILDEWLVEDAYHVELEDDTKYTEVDGISDINQENGFVTSVETSYLNRTSYENTEGFTTFRVSFAVTSPEDVPSQQESSYVTVTTVTQFCTQESGSFSRYDAHLCIGLEDFADLIPEFNYLRSYG